MDSEGGAPVPVHHTGLNSLSLAQYDSVTGGSENFRPSVGERSTATSEVDSDLDSHISAWNRFSIDGKSESAAEEGRVWVDQTHRKQVASKGYTGYDSAGVAHSRFRTPSTATTQSIADMKSPQRDSYSVRSASIACVICH